MSSPVRKRLQFPMGVAGQAPLSLRTQVQPSTGRPATFVTAPVTTILRDLMDLARHRFGGPRFTFPEYEPGYTHALCALRCAIATGSPLPPETLPLSWADLWAPWMLIHTTGRWRAAMLEPDIVHALRVPLVLDGRTVGETVGLTSAEALQLRPRVLMSRDLR